MSNIEETTTTKRAAAVAEQGAQDAPRKAGSKKGSSPKNAAPKGRKTATGAKAKAPAPTKEAKGAKKADKAVPAKETSTPRPASKGAKILELIGRANGASLADIMKESGWQAHSVRGFISTAGKKHGIKIESAKNNAGERVYKTAK